jgi:hypothetical protein
LEKLLFTNAEIAAMLRKERVNQILAGKWDLSDPYAEMAEEMNEDICRRGARDGCGAFNLGEDLRDLFGPDREDAEEIMARIDESWKFPDKKDTGMEWGFESDGEFQIALTLAVLGYDVMSRNDRQAAPHAGDAWVDDKRTEFKSMTSHRDDGLRDHLKKADRKQQVEWAVVDVRPGGMSQGAAQKGLNAFLDGNRAGHVQRVLIFGRDYVIDHTL